MAGDWIKMRPSLVSDYRVVGMADHLLKQTEFTNWFGRSLNDTSSNARYVTRNVTVALCVTALMRVWGAVSDTANREGDDAVMPNASLEALDCISGLPGFGSAMAHVQWVSVRGTALVFPKYLQDNTLKRERSDTAERQRRYRERQAQGAGALRNGNVTRVTKRREEKSNTPPTPQGAKAGGGDSPSLEEIQKAWPSMTAPTAREVADLGLTADELNELDRAADEIKPPLRDKAAWLLVNARKYAERKRKRKPPPVHVCRSADPVEDRTVASAGRSASEIAGGAA